MKVSVLKILLVVAGFTSGFSMVFADAKLIGIGEISGSATDTSGLTDILEDGTPHNRMGGFGSSIDYSGRGHTYLLAPDRGPADGKTTFRDRTYRAEITVDKGRVLFKLIKTVPLTDEVGSGFTGLSAAFSPTGNQGSLRLDPEGIRQGSNGNFYLSDEYGPHLYEFNERGQRIGEFEMPTQLTIVNPAANPADELPRNNLMGRAPNRGMEGLARSPDGSRLFGIMQSSLIQDSVDDDGKRLGTNVRIVVFDVNTRKSIGQYLYVLDHRKNGLNEILAVNDHELLVIERDGKPGRESRSKKIMKIDLSRATNISDIDSLPADELPRNVVPVQKTLLIDMLAPEYKIPLAKIAEKIEGMTFGPNLRGGRRLLLITSDNDFKLNEPSFIYAFSVSDLRNQGQN